MIYGDNPAKWNGDGQDSSGLTIYTYRPNVHAMMQSGNGYMYGLNNPGLYQEPTGNTSVLLTTGAAATGIGALATAAAPIVVPNLVIGGLGYLMLQGGILLHESTKRS